MAGSIAPLPPILDAAISWAYVPDPLDGLLGLGGPPVEVSRFFFPQVRTSKTMVPYSTHQGKKISESKSSSAVAADQSTTSVDAANSQNRAMAEKHRVYLRLFNLHSDNEKAVEARARRAARKVGLVARKSRWRLGWPDNQGTFMLIEPIGNYPVAGFQFDMTAEEVLEYCMED